MKQFYETYCHSEKLSALSREISWSHNLTIVSMCNSDEEREFYLNLVIKERYSFRELERQISASQYERAMLDKPKLSTVLRERKSELTSAFKDSYVFDFLNITESHTEKDLQSGLVKQMKSFILKLRKDFLFVGEEVKLQVGNSDK
jgi:predicted nuclease of restriction endonuclease-like (RecB) superfamily